MARQRVYFFGDGQAEGDPQRKDILGGKGASLAAMSGAKLPVPAGFTISTECCRLFLEADGRWPEGLQQDVRENLSRLEQTTGREFGAADKPLLVSVRSGAAVSMPGMMDTILNCGLTTDMARAETDPVGFWRVYLQFIVMFARTVAGIRAEDFAAVEARFTESIRGGDGALTGEQYQHLAEKYRQLYAARAGRCFPREPWQTLLQGIEAVFRSWDNPRAVTYRREHDIRGLGGTAVNVQSMFASEVSGIVFTANPNALEAGEMIIESSYGLGEAVVSGEVHPDNFVIDRKDLSIKRRTIGHKARVVAAAGRVRRRDPGAASLSDGQVHELVRMALDVEAFFGRPMDIEWGWAEGEFALLQARPVRGLEVAEDVEIGRRDEIRRLRELAREHRKVWVLHNLAETLPNPMPLTWDIIRRFMSGDGGFGQMYKDFGYRPSRQVCREGFLELICGRVYADPERAADLFWDGMPLAYELDEVLRNPKAVESAPKRLDPDKVTPRFLLALPGLIRAVLRSSRLMKQMRRKAVGRFEREVLPPYLEWVQDKRSQDLSALTARRVLDELHERAARALNDFGGESLKPGFFGGMAEAAMRGKLCQLMGPEAGTQLVLKLTQGLEGDSTVEQSQWLYHVAHGQATLREFLDRYGHRAVGEMELARPRWREEASYVRRILSAYQGEGVASPRTHHQANVEQRVEAERQLPETLRRWGGSCLLEEIADDLRDAQVMLPYREIGKDWLMMGYELIRLAILELARRWDLGRDIFFLRLDELEKYQSDSGALAGAITERKLRWRSARRLDMSEVIDSDELAELGLPRQYEAAGEIAAQPIAAGVATGTARIVFDPQQAAGLRSDYILVCPSTDPGWTVLFVHARALVVEQGGMLSHGAIVARDFGIPAVVCPDATRRIPDGASVRVDGSRGLITLLEQQ